MANGIADRFLDDSEEVCRSLSAGNDDRLRTFDRALDSVQICGAFREFLEADEQRVRLGTDWLKTARNPSHLCSHLLQEFRLSRGCGCLRQLLADQGIGEDAMKHAQAGKELPEAVVKISTEPLALTVRSCEEFSILNHRHCECSLCGP
jgi:hypothetical protein